MHLKKDCLQIVAVRMKLAVEMDLQADLETVKVEEMAHVADPP
jgi:hypothetical protein